MSKRKFSVQEYLSLGYLYLILLGLVVEVIYYKFLDVNILNYSSILDVLIAPINVLTRNAWLFFFVLALVTIMTYVMIWFVPKSHQWSKRFKWYRKWYDMEKLDAKYNKEQSTEGILAVAGMLLFGMFLGLSMGSAGKMKDRLAKNDFKLTHRIDFQDGASEKVKIIGQNSTYIFYVAKGDQQVTASPILMNVSKIRKLDVGE